MTFLNELKRRNVFKVGIAYIILSWVLMQVGDTLGPALLLPGWVNSALAFFLLLGFPLALFFAWVFELTPEGVKKQKDVDQSQSITSQTGRKLDYTIIGLLAVALIYFVWEARFESENDPLSEAAVQTQPVTEPEALVTPAVNEPRPTITKHSIAVLPFENRSDLETDQYFTDGIHDDLLTTIAKVGSMKVISRTSVLGYKNTTKKLPEIATELGVANILEGGVQRAGNQVRINVQLIDARTDEHLWAEIYDRELNTENLFIIQSEISKAVVAALQATLSPEEERRIDAMPTDNLQAYEAYLRGRQLMERRKVNELERAVGEFRKATELDPQFALAWVNFSDANGLLAAYGFKSIEDVYPVMVEALARAMDIDNELGEAYVSQALIYEYSHRRDEAEAAFRRAIELSPNYATAYHWYSNFVTESSLLRAAEATKLAQKAFELDPRSSVISVNLANHYTYQGLFLLAERQYQNVIDTDPDFVNAYSQLADLYLRELNQFDKALSLYRKASQLDPGNPSNLLNQLQLYQQLGNFEAMESIRNTIEAATGEDFWLVGFADIWIGVARGDTAGTREALNWLLPKIDKFQYFKELMGPVELLLGNKDRARELFLAANPGWMDPDQWNRLIQENPRFPCLFSWILIHTGDEALGVDLLKQTITFLDVELPAVVEHADKWAPDMCYLTNGDTEKALHSIETQLAHGHLYWRDLFYRMPMYDQIRTEPRFQAVIEERERRISLQRQAVAEMDALSPP